MVGRVRLTYFHLQCIVYSVLSFVGVLYLTHTYIAFSPLRRNDDSVTRFYPFSSFARISYNLVGRKNYVHQHHKHIISKLAEPLMLHIAEKSAIRDTFNGQTIMTKKCYKESTFPSIRNYHYLYMALVCCMQLEAMPHIRNE